ncbi:MAG: ATP-binding protein [Chloroherpetonaceae bacterium]|nr:ATP-binding protein [Chloroherpetonaceae bacterium]MDW8437995.1 ATP-binding protein [Chloroherpetonaceae bacterium]
MLKRRWSIFLKLSALIIVAVALIDAAVLTAFRLAFELPEEPPPSPRGYARVVANYLADEIGSPPDTLKARRFAERLGIAIRLETPRFVWTSSPDMAWEENEPAPPPPDIRRHERHARRRDRRVIAVARGETEFWFRLKELPAPQSFFSTERAILWLLLFLSLIGVGLFFLLRRMFAPIQTLIEGTKRISAGDFATSIKVERRDELGELADSFNAMSKRIAETLQRERELLLDVSHELRSPLTRMKVALELLPDGEAKAQIQRDVNELNAMLTELLESERLRSSHGSLKKSSFSLGELAEEVKAEFRDETHRLVIDAPRNIGLNADKERLRLLLRNLVSNALKYSQDEVKIQLSETPSEVVIRVLDKGKGIAKEELKKIFEPFYRTDSSRSRLNGEGGYGLGLYLCKKIVEAHGGSIEAQSEAGETRFEVRLPK